MGSFNDYLESVKDTPGYAYAKMAQEVTDAIYGQMQERGVTVEELARRMMLPKQEVLDILSGEVSLVSFALACIARALDCDVRIELVPKPIPKKTCSLPDELNADGTVKYKPLRSELNADGTIKRGVNEK